MARIQLKRGPKAALPTSGMLAGEPLVTTDRGTLHIATDATTKLAVVPAIDDLTTLASINGAADLLLIHDADGTGQKEKKITFDAFKTALVKTVSDPRYLRPAVADFATAFLTALSALAVAVVLVLFARRARYFFYDFHFLFPKALARWPNT